MVDRPKLDSMLSNLKTYVEVLRRLASIPLAELSADPDKIGSAKYHLVVAIECCIDIANHIIASERFRLPRDMADSFVVLVERGVCPRELEARLKAMATFRNRLVHLYWQVDDQLVAEYLRDGLDDFDRFVAAVSAAFGG
jgi:uncharacterized protein YutE (UPF0331/DUF86 family)